MQTTILQEIKQFFLHGSVLAKIIGINLAVFLIASVLRVVFYLLNNPVVIDFMGEWFGISSNIYMFFYRPWTILTYMFVHFDLLHILFNMIVLYVGGRLFSDFIGQDRLFPAYLLGGFAGAIFYIFSYNVFPVFREVVSYSIAIGASASVLSIFVAIAVYMPNYRLPFLLIGSIRLKYIALFFVVIDIISIDQGNPGGHLAHLGGAFWGFVYASLLRSGKDPARVFGLWLDAVKRLFRPKPSLRVEYHRDRPLTDEDYNDIKAEERNRMDGILDKISQHGYDSLSKEEKNFLFRMGK